MNNDSSKFFKNIETNLNNLELDDLSLAKTLPDYKISPSMARILCLLLVHPFYRFTYMRDVNDRLEYNLDALEKLDLITARGKIDFIPFNVTKRCQLTDIGTKYARNLFKHPKLLNFSQNIINMLFIIIPIILFMISSIGIMVWFCIGHHNMDAFEAMILSVIASIIMALVPALIEEMLSMWNHGNRIVFHRSSLNIFFKSYWKFYRSKIAPKSIISADMILDLITHTLFSKNSFKRKNTLYSIYINMFSNP